MDAGHHLTPNQAYDIANDKADDKLLQRFNSHRDCPLCKELVNRAYGELKSHPPPIQV
jgi:hypothetical protein